MNDNPFFSGGKLSMTRTEKLAADESAREYIDALPTPEDLTRTQIQIQAESAQRLEERRRQEEAERNQRREELSRLVAQMHLDGEIE
jgi:hypothetical protein